MPSSSEQAEADAIQRLLDDIYCDCSATEVTTVTERKTVEKESTGCRSYDYNGSVSVSTMPSDLYPHTTVLFCDICGEWQTLEVQPGWIAATKRTEVS